jgi:16S rRNA (cytosine967-C5)-methyltransferase
VFDAVLLDAPCTATGTIRRHPDIARLKQPSDVATLADLQRRMLAHAATLVRPGGTIVFATCSLQPEEGPDLIAAALPDLPLEPAPITREEFSAFQPEWVTDGWLRTLPSHPAGAGEIGLDGFFAARLRRT